jgi:arylsulfatase A-like enzyme
MFNTYYITFIVISAISIWYIYNNIFYLPGLIYKFKNPTASTKDITWGANLLQNESNLPNIILVIVDDLGINDLSINTPNINSIYENGANFINFYAGQAMCAPSRASIYTGRFPTNIGFEFTPVPKNLIRAMYYLDNNKIRPPYINIDKFNKLVPVENMVLPLNYTLISDLLHNYGYYNYFLGKWHIGEIKGYTPLDRGYDESLAFLYGASLYEDKQNKSIVTYLNEDSILDKILYTNLPFAISHNNGIKFKPGEYMTDYLTNNALKIISANTNSSSPFFITLAYNAPHNPYQALISDYNSPEFDHILDHNEKVYYAMIKAIDRGIGKIIECLKNENKYDNTMIIFTSDNGGAHYTDIKDINKPYKGFKSTFFEGGIRVPLFVQYPKMIRKNVKYSKLSHHVDIYSTISGIINKIQNNKKINENILDGINLFNDKEKHDILFWKSGKYLCIRDDNWKLSLSEKPKKIWLYDLKNDPTEKVNLLENIKYSSTNYCHNNCTIQYITDKLYDLLIKYNDTAKPSLWESVIEIPIPIINNTIQNENDEYIYWAN